MSELKSMLSVQGWLHRTCSSPHESDAKVEDKQNSSICRIYQYASMIIHICTFKMTPAQQKASNVLHTLPLTTGLPQNDLLRLVLEMNPTMKIHLCFSKAVQTPTSQKDTSHFTKLLLWKHSQQSPQEPHGNCHRRV